MKPKKEKTQKKEHKLNLVVFLWVLLGVFMLHSIFTQSHTESIPYSEFLNLLEKGQVADVVFSDSTINGKIRTSTDSKDTRYFVTNAVPNESLSAKLAAQGVIFRSEPLSPFWGLLFTWLIPALIFYGIWVFATRGLNKGAGGLLSMTKSQAKIYMEKDIKTTFADVAGIDEAKGELLEVVSFLQDPQKYSRLGGRAPKGVLLVGPPGTGKTLLARAVAGEAKVPFFSINGSEFVEMFVGLGAARVRDLFNQARSQAPCILFIDEIDALGKSRAFGYMGTGTNEEKEQTLNQLLAEMDGFDASKGVIMLAATNRPEILDPALLRAGRFDRQILLSSPDQASRRQILAVHAKNIKTDKNLNLEHIANLSPGFSGADLANLVNEAALVATRRNAECVGEEDFMQAIERLVAGLEKKSKVMNQREKERIAYHELGHATVALGLNCEDKVYKVSIIPRGMGALGYTIQRPTEDRYILDEGELLDKIAVLLGGRASEIIFCGKVSTGSADDLAKATEIARSMVTQFGMSEKIGMVSLEGKRSPFLLSPFEPALKSQSERTAGEIDAEIKALLEKGFRRAAECIKRNRVFTTEAFQLLIKSETLNEAEIRRLWEQHSSLFRQFDTLHLTL